MNNISFSVTELETISHSGELGNIDELAKLLHKSRIQAYRTFKSLREKKVFDGVNLAALPYLKKLVLLVKKYPQLIQVLRGTGLPVLLEMRNPKTVKEIALHTQLSEQLVYKTIQKAQKFSLLSKDKQKYSLNQTAWPEAVAFFEDLFEQEMNFDERIPNDSVIYHKSNKDILFSNKREIDATPTAFSAFDLYGIKLYPVTNYYYLPKKTLSKKEVFNHALRVVKKEFDEKKEYDVRSIIFIGLFAFKNTIHSEDEIVKNLLKVISGKKIEGYPSREELKEKASMYGIELP